MEKKKISYEELMDTLKSYPPVPQDTDAITAGIMDRIAQMPPRKKTAKVVTWSLRLSGMAAATLMGFLLYEIFFVKKVTSLSSPSYTQTYVSGLQPAACMQRDGKKDAQGRLNCFLKEQEQQRSVKQLQFMNLIK